MNKIVIKTTVGFLSLGLITGAGILTKNYIKHDGGLTYTTKSAQKNSSLKNMEQEVKQAEEELNKAKEDKEAAEQEVKNAEEAINEASKEKEEALAELENAKTPEEKKVAQAKIDAATEKIKQAEETKKSAEKKVEEATKTVEEKEQNKKDAEEKVAEAKKTESKENKVASNKTSESNSTTESKKTQSTTKNNTTTKQEQKQENKSEEQGSKFNLSDYPELMDKINKTTEEQVKQIEEEAKKKTVEFNFYSANKELFISCRGDHCGEDQQGYIWFVELECDLNKCEGFTDPSTGTKVSNLLSGRRGDVTTYTVMAPAAKYGYRFVGWQLVSTRKMATSDLGTGIVLGKYIATYEKIQ